MTPTARGRRSHRETDPLPPLFRSKSRIDPDPGFFKEAEARGRRVEVPGYHPFLKTDGCLIQRYLIFPVAP